MILYHVQLLEKNLYKDPENRPHFLFDDKMRTLLFLVPHHTMYGNFGNRANFRLPVFGGYTHFGVWRIQKTQN